MITAIMFLCVVAIAQLFFSLYLAKVCLKEQERIKTAIESEAERRQDFLSGRINGLYNQIFADNSNLVSLMERVSNLEVLKDRHVEALLALGCAEKMLNGKRKIPNKITPKKGRK